VFLVEAGAKIICSGASAGLFVCYFVPLGFFVCTVEAVGSVSDFS
jgi:hypothetical protein